MSALLPNLQKMTAREKLQAIEELWDSLTLREKEAHIPAWHADALAETQSRYDAGQEPPVPWEDAKARLHSHRQKP